MFAVFRIIVGAMFGILCAFALSPGLAALHSDGSNFSSISAFVLIAIMAILGFFAPTIRRAFGRGFLLLGLCCFALPFSAMLLSGRATNEVISQASMDNQAAVAIGAGAASIAVTGIATFVGLIAGAIFVVLGLVLALGGRREVIIVNR